MANTAALHIARVLGELAAGMAPADTNLASLGQSVQGGAQSGLMGEAIEKQKKAEKKAKKGALGGDIGALLGTVGGVAAAPFTGGSSLIASTLLGGAGAAAGGAAGSALMGGGGGMDPYAAIRHSLMGGLSAATMPQATPRTDAPLMGGPVPGRGANLQTSGAANVGNPFMRNVPQPMGGQFSGQQQGFGQRLQATLGGLLNPTGASPHGAFRLMPDPQNPNRFILGGGGY